MQFLTQSQVRDILRLIPNDRDRCALLVAYLHGLRISELTALRVKDTEGGYLNVKRLKGSKRTLQAVIYAPSDLVLDEASALKDVVRKYELGPDDRLFPKDPATYWRIMKRAGKLAGLPEALCHPHVLKHSIAMHLVRRMDIKDLQQYLGHKSLSSTGVYLDSTDAQASAAVAKVFAEEEK